MSESINIPGTTYVYQKTFHPGQRLRSRQDQLKPHSRKEAGGKVRLATLETASMLSQSL